MIRSLLARLILCTAIGAVAFPDVACAQTTGKFSITISNCAGIDDVAVVIDGEDATPDTVKPDPEAPGDPCRRVLDINPNTVDVSDTTFSLRLTPIARSRCMKAEWRDDTRPAHLHYACCTDGPVKQVIMDAMPRIRIAYARDVFGKSGCIEQGILWEAGPEKQRTVRDVNPDIEDLRVKVLQEQPACGWSIDRHIEKLDQGTVAIAAKDLVSDPRHIVDPRRCSAQYFSGVDLDLKEKAGRQFDSLRISVK